MLNKKKGRKKLGEKDMDEEIRKALESINLQLAAINGQLGELKSNQANFCKSQDKMFYGLLGIIAALVGIKMLNTDPLLYVVTALAAVGTFMGIGLVKNALIRKDKLVLSKAGWALASFVIMGIVVQVFVFFRDVQFAAVTPRLVYILRTIMNAAFIVFVWLFWEDTRIFKRRKK